MPLVPEGGVEIAALPGKSIFELNRYARIRPASESVEPQILALSCGQGFDFETWVREVQEPLWQRAAAQRMRVVFDATTEGGLFDRQAVKTLLKFLKARGIGARQTIYLTQERGWDADYRTEFDLPPESRIRVMNADYFIRRYFCTLERSGADLFALRHERFLARQAHRPHRFISFNYTPREAKVVFLLQLMRDGLWDKGMISFGGLPKDDTVKPMRVREWGQELDALAPYAERLAALGRIVIGEDQDLIAGSRMPVDDSNLPEHDRTWFSVVTESEMRSRPSRVTEKPCKPLVNFHPLIFLGNPGALALLREFGFESFSGFFDESYDEENDPKKRFAMAYNEILALCRADETELARRAARVSEQLVYNARRGLTELPRLFRQRFDRDLLNAILDGSGRIEASSYAANPA
ncbi:MAG: hypothetical protein BGN86_12635 [Caulobacterales bacterium 68-7]|nr:MAG: hypothetical protein BGN86_12635 [Caulobacterales bacterium 68-7]